MQSTVDETLGGLTPTSQSVFGLPKGFIENPTPTPCTGVVCPKMSKMLRLFRIALHLALAGI